MLFTFIMVTALAACIMVFLILDHRKTISKKYNANTTDHYYISRKDDRNW